VQVTNHLAGIPESRLRLACSPQQARMHDTEVEAAQANYSVAKATRDDAPCLTTDPCLLRGADVPDGSSVAIETVTCLPRFALSARTWACRQ